MVKGGHVAQADHLRIQEAEEEGSPQYKAKVVDIVSSRPVRTTGLKHGKDRRKRIRKEGRKKEKQEEINKKEMNERERKTA